MDADDEASFREFVNSRLSRLQGLAYVVCGDWQAAEDAVAGALSRLYLRWGSVTSPDSYASTAVVRAAIREKRRPWRREQVFGDALPEVAGPDRTGDVDERLRLQAALRQVPPRQRAVLALRFLEGLSVEQTAETLGCRTGTVKSQTKRGLDTLRAVLAADNINLLTKQEGERVLSGQGSF